MLFRYLHCRIFTRRLFSSLYWLMSALLAPLSLYFQIGFVHPPPITWPFLLFMEGLFQLRCVLNNPSIQGAMINPKTSLCHHLFNVSIAEWICTVPTDTLKDDRLRGVSAFERDHVLLNWGWIGNNILTYRAWATRDATEPLGEWLASNGEGIYSTRPWERAQGETAEGEAVRFTKRDNVLYAIVFDVTRRDELRLLDISEPNISSISLYSTV